MESNQPTDRWARASAIACRVLAYAAAALIAAPLLYHLAHGSRAYLGLFEDDFFYYTIIADKLATLGKLTFDGLTRTNGFHPMWFGVIWILRVLTGSVGTAFFALLAFLLFGLMVASYELSCRLARSLGAPLRSPPPSVRSSRSAPTAS